MLASQRSLVSAQLNRNTLTEINESPAPVREAALETFRRRNAFLDAWFYDVGKVAADEAAALSPWLAREGSILIVPPSGAGTLRLCRDIEEFASQGGRDVRALTVAGVGSSALGSAAFARNVADAFGAPVASVVSGYGLADLVTEAAGGWFWFGGLNKWRHDLEVLDEMARRASLSPVEETSPAAAHLGNVSLDTRRMYRLLIDPRFKFSLLSGHSKGNLVISEALFAIDNSAQASGHQPEADTWIVTVSAAIFMPPRFGKVIDVMGSIDWFGAFNSRHGIGIEKRSDWSWHHTNTELPLHLPVTATFRELAQTHGLAL